MKSASRAQRWVYPFTRSPVHPFTFLLLLYAMAFSAAGAQDSTRPSPLKSGLEYAGAEVRALHRDEFSSPAMLWAARGENLWHEPAGASNQSCASCHQDARISMKGVSAHYPKYVKAESGTAQLTNMEGRINQCRVQNQRAAPLRYETDELLALTAYVGMQSRGLPLRVALDTQNQLNFERGKAIFYTRMGQMNLACTHCHDRNAGGKLLNDTISQGHGNPYPAYRLEWQTVGSLHRRLRACFFGVRAERPPAGSQDLLDLELFLAWRAQGLHVETPGVRR